MYYLVIISEKMLKNHTSKPPNELKISIFHHNGSNFGIEFRLQIYHQGAWIYRGLKMTFGNPSPLVVEFQTIFYIKI